MPRTQSPPPLDRSDAVPVKHGKPTGYSRWDWRDPEGQRLDVIVSCPDCTCTNFIEWDAIDSGGYAPFICCGCGLNRPLKLLGLMPKGAPPKRVNQRARRRAQR